MSLDANITRFFPSFLLLPSLFLAPPPHRPSRRQHWCSQQSLTPPTSPGVDNQSASQFALLQKLALLKLTALMDKLSPSSKQGWSW